MITAVSGLPFKCSRLHRRIKSVRKAVKKQATQFRIRNARANVCKILLDDVRPKATVAGLGPLSCRFRGLHHVGEERCHKGGSGCPQDLSPRRLHSAAFHS